MAELGGGDLLVNGVGGLAGMPMGGQPDIGDVTWKQGFDLNFYSMVRVTRGLLPSLRSAVVNISTGVARWPSAGPYR